MRRLTISHAARTAGVTIETIRFYERRGLIDQPPKPLAGAREYDEGLIARIRFIRQAQEIGFLCGRSKTCCRSAPIPMPIAPT